MAKQAVAFVDSTHGGQAVFAARLDRDEAGETIVDVFAAPKYEKRTKRTPTDRPGVMWASATKFGRALAEKHQDEIRRRHPDAKPGEPLTSPRMVGIALQSEFHAFFETANGVPLTPKALKESRQGDRLEIEAYKKIEEETARQAAQRDELERNVRRFETMTSVIAQLLGERVGEKISKTLHSIRLSLVKAGRQSNASVAPRPEKPKAEASGNDVGPFI